MVKSWNKLTENIEILRENTRVFHTLHIFSHIFTGENMENSGNHIINIYVCMYVCSSHLSRH